MAYAAFLFLPTAQAAYSCVDMDGNRGIYNSAWVGAQVTLMTVSILALVGFYFVRGGIGRDEGYRVKEVVAATPLKDFEYIAGKAASNALVLAAMTLVLAAMAAVMQLVRGESTALDPAVLFAPFIVIILPMMIVIAALAAMFDSMRRLRGGVGNVLFFVGWAISIATAGINNKVVHPSFDLFGVFFLWNQMMDACAAAVPGYVPWEGIHSLGFNIKATGISAVQPTFTWDGPVWTGEFLVGRAFMILAAIAAVGGGAAAYRRFDTATGSLWQRLTRKSAEFPPSEQDEVAIDERPQQVVLTPLSGYAVATRFGAVVIAELRLLLARVSRWWYLIAGGLILAGLLVPFAIAHQFLFAAAWFWPLLIWSQMGCRERLHGTEPIVLATPRFVTRQFFAQWIAGTLVTAAVGSFMAVRFIFAGDLAGVGHWTIGAAFIPALAITCGAATGGRKLFEVTYTLLWYIGPLNKLPLLDFTGSAIASQNYPHLTLWAGITVVTVVLGLLARWRQTRSA